MTTPKTAEQPIPICDWRCFEYGDGHAHDCPVLREITDARATLAKVQRQRDALLTAAFDAAEALDMPFGDADTRTLKERAQLRMQELHDFDMERERQQQRADAAERLLNSPELHSFAEGVVLEAAHQRHRWGSDHDAGKKPEDWFWLIGYLAGKALRAHSTGDTMKALHHTISAAAALNNWHAQISGASNAMRPGLSEDATAALAAAGDDTSDANAKGGR